VVGKSCRRWGERFCGRRGRVLLRVEGGGQGEEAEDALNRELNARIRELFGEKGERNQARSGPGRVYREDMSLEEALNVGVRQVRSDQRETEMARQTLMSTAVLSVLALILSLGLIFSGSIHGGNTGDNRTRPTYGTPSYIDGYEMLQQDREQNPVSDED